MKTEIATSYHEINNDNIEESKTLTSKQQFTKLEIKAILPNQAITEIANSWLESIDNKSIVTSSVIVSASNFNTTNATNFIIDLNNCGLDLKAKEFISHLSTLITNSQSKNINIWVHDLAYTLGSSAKFSNLMNIMQATSRFNGKTLNVILDSSTTGLSEGYELIGDFKNPFKTQDRSLLAYLFAPTKFNFYFSKYPALKDTQDGKLNNFELDMMVQDLENVHKTNYIRKFLNHYDLRDEFRSQNHGAFINSTEEANLFNRVCSFDIYNDVEILLVAQDIIDKFKKTHEEKSSGNKYFYLIDQTKILTKFLKEKGFTEAAKQIKLQIKESVEMLVFYEAISEKLEAADKLREYRDLRPISIPIDPFTYTEDVTGEQFIQTEEKKCHSPT